MRLLLTSALLLLGACRTTGSFGEDAAEADRLLRHEQFNDAFAVADKTLPRIERLRDPMLLWRFRLIRADGLMGQRKFADVLESFAEYGEPPAGPQWHSTRAHFLLLAVQAQDRLGHPERARALLSSAREEAIASGSRALVAEVDLRDGSLTEATGDYKAARRIYDRVLASATALKDRGLEMRVATNYGITFSDESRHDVAIPWFERAVSVADAIGAADNAARNRGDLGLCYWRLGEHDAARVNLEAARAHFEAAGNLFELQIWTGNLGNVLIDVGDSTEGVSSYKTALSIARRIHDDKWSSRWLSNLAGTSIDLEDWEAADRYNREGLALNRAANDDLYKPISESRAALIAVGRGRFEDAAALFRQILRERTEDPVVALEARTGLAGIYLRTGEPRKADEEFKAAIFEIESRQAHLLKDEYKLSWLASLISFYREYTDFLVAQGKPDEALRVSESSRSKVLTGGAPSPADLKPRTASEYRELARASGATILEYFFGRTASYLWVVTPEAIHFHTLPARSMLQPWVDRYAAVAVGGRDPLKVASDTGVKLYDTLVAPARADAPHSDRFIVMPDEDLYSLNFETLPDGDNTGRFLIESAGFRTAPSMAYLSEARKEPHKGVGSRLLLIGDAVGSETFPKLKFASEEIASIAAAMPGQTPAVLKDAAATPEAYRTANPGEFGYIHFAAHASMNSANPLDSAVILSGPPEKGRLLARTVVSIPLKSQLVTVSACRSAGGKPYAGEGLVGFAWAFLKAGSANVIAGLWDVSDKSTTQLMTDVYTRIGKGVPIPDALRESKLALIHGGGAYARPYYWAPFQLYTARP
jgi:CHAT domain-containing protein/Tfp pilus assembly protein PilF